jgi:hypothetical protein
MVLWRVHMEPISMSRWQHDISSKRLLRFITYHGTIPIPRVDKPHPASIARTWLAVAGRPGKVIAQVVWNGPCVAYRYHWQFPENTLNWNDVQNWISVVELIYNSRTNGTQPAEINSISTIINIIEIITIITINY